MKEADLNTEQRILEAAERLFLEKGFALSSTVEIARIANCNQALVHYYFRSKEKLFEKVFEKNATMFLSSFLKGGDDALSFEEKIKMKIESHFDMIAANPRLPFLFFNEVLTNPNRLRMVREKVSHLPASILSQLQQDLDVETAAKRVRPITAIDLMVTVFSLNVILFLVKPVLREVVGISEEAYSLLLAHRKEENVETILKSLRP